MTLQEAQKRLEDSPLRRLRQAENEEIEILEFKEQTYSEEVKDAPSKS